MHQRPILMVLSHIQSWDIYAMHLKLRFIIGIGIEIHVIVWITDQASHTQGYSYQCVCYEMKTLQQMKGFIPRVLHVRPFVFTIRSSNLKQKEFPSVYREFSVFSCCCCLCMYHFAGTGRLRSGTAPVCTFLVVHWVLFAKMAKSWSGVSFFSSCSPF